MCSLRLAISHLSVFVTAAEFSGTAAGIARTRHSLCRDSNRLEGHSRNKDSNHGALQSLTVSRIPSSAKLVCKRCKTDLQSGALVCKNCHALVHAEELEQLAAGAKMLEQRGELLQAKEQWLKGIQLLPADSKQAAWIQDHARSLELAASVSTPKPASKEVAGTFCSTCSDCGRAQQG